MYDIMQRLYRKRIEFDKKTSVYPKRYHISKKIINIKNIGHKFFHACIRTWRIWFVILSDVKNQLVISSMIRVFYACSLFRVEKQYFKYWSKSFNPTLFKSQITSSKYFNEVTFLKFSKIFPILGKTTKTRSENREYAESLSLL